ncbi:TonB-dependent receptor [Sulfurimonas sp. HSL1-2]|uniref:TonB-dependent receptor n=1 Tax=Thiomicrolovo zhangzhouensis TaxID=3131933 RepID=UPI0031F95F57
MKKIALSLAVAALAGSALNAQGITLEALTVTSSPLHSTELDAADSVEVYTAEEIEKSHARSLYEFITLQTSLFALPSYGNPMAQRLDLHGYGIENGYQNIVVTLNGRRLNNVDMVPQLLSSIAPADIERLEIVKGGGIVLGGDGASAGAIHIVTRNDNTKEVSFYGGLYGTYDAAFRVGHSDDFLTVSASGEAYHTAGTRHIDAAQNRDEQQLANGTFDLALTPGELFEFRLGAQASRIDAAYGSTLTQSEFNDDPAQPGAFPAPAYQQYDTDAFTAGLTLFPTADLSVSLDTSVEKKKSVYDLPAWFYRSVANYDYRTATLALDYTQGGLQLSLGGTLFDGSRNSGATAFAIASETTKKNSAAYALAQYRTGDHTLKAGYRYETVRYDYRDAGNALDRSETLHGIEAGYNLRLSPERSLFVSYAHAYQAPDVDRFFNRDFSGVVTFNGFIDPMTSDTVTAGYTAVTAANKFKLSAYYAALENEIYYYSDPAYIASVNTNIDRSHKVGVDLFEQWKVTERFGLSLNYNYVQAVIDKEVQNGEDFGGNDLPGVSPHTLKAALTILPTDALSLTLSHTYRSQAYAMNDFGNSFAQKQRAFNSTDVVLNYDTASYALFAKINNMFNNPNGLWVADDAIYPVNFTTTALVGATLKF